MTKDKSFHDYVVYDLLGDVRDITSKAMFSGWAIYKKGIIFALIVSGELYFKVDDSNRSEFERMGSRPFVYSRNDGKSVTLSYWFVPEEITENREELYNLLEKSVAISKKQKP